MEEAQLIVLFPQNKKERITKFQKLAKVVPPNRVSDLNTKNTEILKDFFLFASPAFDIKIFQLCNLFYIKRTFFTVS